MKPKSKSVLFAIAVLGCLLAACGPRRPKFVAPEIEPPADLIPSYVPEGYELIGGFQIEGELTDIAEGISGITGRLLFELKSPAGNDIQGVQYRDENHILLITKSLYPGGTLDLWREAFEETLAKPFGCECGCDDGHKCACDCCPDHPDRVNFNPFPDRFEEFQEERTVEGMRVAVLKSGDRWITVFMRGEYLLTVVGGIALEEGGITLEENLKIVASLLAIQP